MGPAPERGSRPTHHRRTASQKNIDPHADAAQHTDHDREFLDCRLTEREIRRELRRLAFDWNLGLWELHEVKRYLEQFR